MDEVTKENPKSLSELKEQIQEDIKRYWESYSDSVPFVFMHEAQEENVRDLLWSSRPSCLSMPLSSLNSDLCDIVTNRLNQFIEQQPVSRMVMELYHGRKNPDQDMGDWGSQGPLLFVDGVTVTYKDSIRIRFTGQYDYIFLEEFLHEDMFFYDGVYYGDFAFLPVDSKIKNENSQEAELFDPNKALKKENDG